MSEEIYNRETLEKYLLGMIEDFELLEKIEDRLADDSEFSLQLEFVQDDLIESYVVNNLTGEQLEKFERLFLKSSERRKKIANTKALLALAKEAEAEADKQANSEKSGFWDWLSISPKWALGFAVPVIFAVVFGFWFTGFYEGETGDYIAKIDSLYNNTRPTQARIADFKYLPHSSIRGAEVEKDASLNRQKRIIETKLLENAESEPSAEHLNDLGVFYLTERKFDEAIEQFNQALTINKDFTQARSNLGVAYFEKADQVTEPDEKLKQLAMALEETTKAINSGDKSLELLFNRALILQEMNVPAQAIEAWKLYLEKDKDSKWAIEAEKNLNNLEKNKNNTFKSNKQVYDDFLEAFEKNDRETAWKIHSQTKEVNAQKFLPMQIVRRYLEADKKKDLPEAEKNLKALGYIGELEKEKNADVFFSDLAEFYSQAGQQEKDVLILAHQSLKEGLEDLSGSRYGDAVTNLKESRKLFLSVNNKLEAGLSEVPLAFCLTRSTQMNESNKFLENVEKLARAKKYKWLLTTGLDWKTSNLLIANETSKGIATGKETLKIAEETNNVYGIQRMSENLSELYSELGETANSLKYLAKTTSFKNLYNENHKQKWRNLKGHSELFNNFKLYESAIVFGSEYVNIAKDLKSDPAHLKLSYYLFARIFTNKGDFEKASETIKLGDQIILDKTQIHVLNNLKSFAKLEEGNIKRNLGKYSEAIKDYDEAIAIFSMSSDYSLPKFSAEKGKLVCLWKENKQEETEDQLKKILEMFKQNRVYLLEEQSRNSFFHNEQTIYDIAIDFSLKKGDSQRAFDYSKDSKARSLLDFIENGANVNQGDLSYKSVSKPLSLKEIQRRMPAQTQLINYALLPDKVVVWIVEKNKFEYVVKNYEYEKLNELIEDYLILLKNNKNNSEKIKSKSNEIFEVIIEPIIAKLDKEKQLFIVADKALHLLPFASLYSNKTKRFMIEDFTLTNTPSPTIFILTTENSVSKSEKESIITIGNPTFDREENRNLENLDSAKEEAVEVSKFYNEKEVFLEKQATKDRLLEKFNSAEIIHFAGHYVANEKSPLNSKLLMAKNESALESDLRVLEIAERKGDRLKLVVLSACQTDVEQFYFGEGAIGAARVFLAVGSPIVVASFYEVDSESTSKIMINFHRYRKDKNLSVAEALRQSQIDAIKNNDSTKESPYYWFAFAPTGGFTNY